MRRLYPQGYITVYFHVLPSCVDEEGIPAAERLNRRWRVSHNGPLLVTVPGPRQAHLISFAFPLSSSTLATGGQMPVALDSPGWRATQLGIMTWIQLCAYVYAPVHVQQPFRAFIFPSFHQFSLSVSNANTAMMVFLVISPGEVVDYTHEACPSSLPAL